MTSLLHAIIDFLVPHAEAADPGVWGIYCSAFGACGEGRTFLVDLAGRAVTMVFILIGSGCVLVVLYAAIRIVSSGIDESGHQEAKKMMTNATIGLVLAIMGWSIVSYVGRLVLLIAGF